MSESKEFIWMQMNDKSLDKDMGSIQVFASLWNVNIIMV